MDTEKIQIGDIPDPIISYVCDTIAAFTVGLQRITRSEKREDIFLVGNGTLIIVDTSYCILTAEHVLAQFRHGDRLSLLTSFSGQPHRHRFDLSQLQIHKIAKGEDDAKGPNIGLIVLHRTNIGWLLAEKSFYSIDRFRKRFADAFIEREFGCWFMCGIIGESEQYLTPQSGPVAIKGYRGLCGASAIRTEYNDSGFDYLDVGVSYKPDNPKLPSSFGGFSGCGVWQVPLVKNHRGEIEPEEYVLSGVVFYETAVEDGIRLLRCHGRKTVYVNVPQFLQGRKDF